MARAEGSRQCSRNVLLHGREEITAKECAVPRPGLGERERKQQAGKINSVSPRATVLWSQFFPFSLLNKNDVSHCSGCTRAAKSSGCSSVSSKLRSPPQARTEHMRPLVGVTLSAGPCRSRMHQHQPGSSSHGPFLRLIHEHYPLWQELFTSTISITFFRPSASLEPPKPPGLVALSWEHCPGQE